MDEAYDRGYQRGFADGAEKNQNAAPWNLPDVKPKDGEDILAIVRPFDWRSRRQVEKSGVDCVAVFGWFSEEKTVDLGGFITNTPDQICLEERKDAILWSEVWYWLPVTIPKHMQEEIMGGEL